jgi:Fe-S cluster biosynthesis and repair protein YggX|tara:strand:- start:648 stop:1226 length:579 start_codon:yes stop_codon:yes gene_type:complete
MMDNNFNGIEEYKNAFPIEYCKKIIDTFEQRAEMQLTEHQTGFKNQDERIFMDMANHNNMFHVDANLCKFFYQTIMDTYEHKYRKKYDSLGSVCQHSPKGMSVQKTRPHQGYHAWHCENADLVTSSRVMAYTLYLNSVEEGGETEFLYQGVKIKPEPGKLAIFPAYYTHPHRGNPIYKGIKYIVSGWYTFDE